MKDEKTLSCGVIIHNEKGEILLGRCNAKEIEEWDIPKGQIDEGETEIQCALRELEEETSIKLSENDLIRIGYFNYSDTKRLCLFKAKINPPKIKNLKCTSLFNHPTLGMIPEMDKHAYVSFVEMRKIVPTELYNAILAYGFNCMGVDD